MTSKEKKSKGSGWRITFSVLGVLFLVLGCAFFLSSLFSIQAAQNTTGPALSLEDLFSGASSLALFIISIIVALAALVQWPALKDEVRKEIEESRAAQRATRAAMIRSQRRLERLTIDLQKQVAALEEKTREKEAALQAALRDRFDFLEKAIKESASQTTKEVRARAITTMGFLVGTLHSDPWVEVQEEKNREHLAEAVYLCQKGFEDLKEVPGEGKYMALNNLVYYSTLLRRDENREILLEQAREIKNYAKDAKYGAFYILTFCRAVGTYGHTLTELKEAHFLADQISTSDDVTVMTKNEATYVVALIQKRIKALTRQDEERS